MKYLYHTPCTLNPPALFLPFTLLCLLCNSNRLKKLLCPPYALRLQIDVFVWTAKITALLYNVYGVIKSALIPMYLSKSTVTKFLVVLEVR